MGVVKICKYSLITVLSYLCLRQILTDGFKYPAVTLGTICGVVVLYIIIRFVYHLFSKKNRSKYTQEVKHENEKQAITADADGE